MSGALCLQEHGKQALSAPCKPAEVLADPIGAGDAFLAGSLAVYVKQTIDSTEEFLQSRSRQPRKAPALCPCIPRKRKRALGWVSEAQT